MKTTLILLALIAPSSAFADVTCNQAGSFTYCNDSDYGARSTTNRVGSFSYTDETSDDGQMHHTVCNKVGQFTYCN